jgi:hypothetical protein
MSANPAPEIWRPIQGYEGFYEVSDRGRVRSVARDITLDHPNGGAVVHRRQSVILATKPKRNGCLIVCLSRENRHFSIAVNRLVLETFVGPRPPGWLAIPDDGDKGNCAIENLAWRPRGSTRARTA